ncbi:MAG TPA: Ig-like domain repeat protein [Gemmatimonadales bacterium]|nr:Ig-like domain repeat protein [Gemmatimonadales bacterium]
MTTIRRRLASLIALGLAVLAFACGGDGVVLPNESKPAFITRVSGDSQSAAAGQALELPLIVRVADALDRPVEGQVVAFAVGAGGGQVTPASATTGADGKASVTWTLGGAAGQQKVRASVTGDGVPDGLLVDFSATAVSGAGAKLVLVSGDNQTAAVRSALPESLVVRVTDALDNPVPGVEVTWDVGGGGSISPGSVTTDASGLAAAQRVLGNASGTQTASASSTGLTSVTFTQTAVAANPTALILVSGDAQSAPANSTLTDPLVVRLVDDNGNGVGNKAITWVVAPGSGSVNPQNVTTDPTGFAQTSWTLGSGAGGKQVSAVFSGLPAVPFSATALAGAATKLAFSQAPVNTSAGSPITPAVKVAIQDAAGNTVTSATDAITIAIANNPNGGTLFGTLTAGAVNGVATFAGLSIDRSGDGYTLSASASGLTTATSPSFDVLPGAANRLVFLTGPTNRVVGEKFSPALQVQVQDAGGNPVLLATGQITITSSVTGTLGGTATATPILGTATFNNLAINKAGTGYTLTALASGVSSVTSAAFDVNQASTTIAITSKSPPGNSVFGQAVTFNYDVNIVAPGAGSLTGSVIVSDGTDSCTGGITAGGGTGSCPITFGSTGSRSVTAVYSGDPNFVGSTSGAVSHTVSKASTQLTITSDDPEPSDPNQTVTVKWTLSPTGAGAGTPTGTVTVGGGAGVTPCSVAAAFGTSSCDLVFATSGNKTITASYSGDGNFNASSDNEPHTVTTPNVPPVASGDAFSTNEDASLTVNAANGVLKNDDDPDNGPQALQARNFSTPAHGTLDGHADGSFTYTPDADFNGSDSFTYEAFDGAASDQATVTITINSVNDAPSFTSGGDVTVSLAAGPVSQAWATNASPGPANESGQTLAYQLSFDPDFPFGPEFFTIEPSISPDGTLSFTPGFIGVAHMIVHVQDNGGTQNGGTDTSADQKFTITINP